MFRRMAALFIVLPIFISCSDNGINTGNITVYENRGSNEEIILENDYLEFRFTPADTGFILTDKSSGARWHSNPDASGDALADPVTRELMQSQFSLVYADTAGVGMTLLSSEHSVAKNAYEYEIVDDAFGRALEVRYTVGELVRTYIFPAAVPEERMLQYTSIMSQDDRRKVEACYRLYDINNLRENDNKNTLLALYPDLANVKMYVLRDNTQEYMKEQMDVFFSDAGYSYDDYLADTARYASASGANKPVFNITLRYSLEGRNLILSVPFDRMAYLAAYPITQLSLLPFMGAGGPGDEGYLFVPDGCGALIHFNNGRENQIAYNISVYGWDEAMPRDTLVSDNKAPFPAYGVHKNGSSLLCVIENGSAYAGIRADVSGRNCSWNSVYSHYSMIHGAIMDISGRSDRAVYIYEKSLPPGESITLRITPCADAGYVGMAKEYRAWLLGKFPTTETTGEDVPVAVEIVGAVNKTMHRLGMPFDLPLALTSYKETESMMSDFSGCGWKNVRVKLNGWFNRSVDHSVPSRIKLIRELGGKRGFRKMVSSAEDYNFELYPEADFLYMKDVKPSDGFSLYRDCARYINRKRIEKYPFSIVWFGERSQWGKLSHVIRPASMMQMIGDFSGRAAGLGLENIAFRSMGGRLSGDYNEKRHVSREAAMKMRQEKLAEISHAGGKIMVDTGFSYTIPWVDFITGMAIDDQGFGITDVSVPFYQIALHGIVPYTGKAINLAEDYTVNLLKTVECGAGLYFSFMAAETSVLQETKFRQFYANEYGKWAPDADMLYRRFSADFSGLYNQAIDNHEIIAPGVTITTYEDGTRVAVNCRPVEFCYNDINIDAYNYAVIRQGN